MWHMHLNMHLTKFLHAFCVHFECTSKCYHNERKYCSYYSATSCCQEINNKFWKIEWLSIIFNQEINIKKWTKWTKNTSTNYNLQMWPFKPAKESLCFLRGPLEWLMVVKNVNFICFWLEVTYVIAKCGNVNDKIFVRWQNNCLCQTNMSPRSYM